MRFDVIVATLLAAVAPSDGFAVVSSTRRVGVSFATLLRAETETAEATKTNTLEGREIQGDIVPLNNFVLVKTVGVVEKTDSGIMLAGSEKVVKTKGKVVSVGPGRTHQETGRSIEIPFLNGDSVLYGEYDGIELDFNGETHMLVRDTDVLIKYSGDTLTLDAVDVVRDMVLIEVDAKDQTTAGGVLLADAGRDGSNRPSTGTVVKVGPGKMAGDGSILPMRAKVGDRVKFRDYAGNEVDIDKKQYSVVPMEDVMAMF
uniref:20 kDa chaperonin, chloroplastic n=1 Tax=Grammatophora oceanica TaxID=210454 RepID=A0A7S1UT19_9STRA|mmetsp:Transcript_17858/g.26444  ORF Transcript_17858/g.26444 Transcript_17858/m.26444 type:complete len:258 (+) Transcript_17858:150-923(+)|eukprot:CAMPEP_0194046852 /NCGR_PEP_ID=MMETSP0009_2-20130614/22660_1 /TAXON_ID=210454 /ORGANISM="Grammatophora oceanica, Strain CCMP 410" /LENGTH=257 /DNA_ID=CAMNT_0038692297 /DNA_START=117 /DNA_END=890 /DNA_ORIENTATION=+